MHILVAALDLVVPVRGFLLVSLWDSAQ
ncbi:unnamed protein product [Timema podura]|uniref:Uncharacterized protein n=1 Tax=Timema podura TaxID=61482 RepID=A0ABN7NNV9_TIMPD|nr:unnamed protein product [Timema podura]